MHSYGREHKHKNVWKIFTTFRSYIFSSLRPITFKFGSFTNIKALFAVVLTDIP